MQDEHKETAERLARIVKTMTFMVTEKPIEFRIGTGSLICGFVQGRFEEEGETKYAVSLQNFDHGLEFGTPFSEVGSDYKHDPQSVIVATDKEHAVRIYAAIMKKDEDWIKSKIGAKFEDFFKEMKND